MTLRDACPYCGLPMVIPSGVRSAKILLVGEYPGWQELKSGVPFSGPTGDILRNETARVGIDFNACRITNLWQHANPNNKTEREAMNTCFLQFMGDLILEMENRHVLLMGSELVDIFLNSDVGVMDISGLRSTSPLFPSTSKVTMFTPNPALALHQTHGEFRRAMERFKIAVDNYKEN